MKIELIQGSFLCGYDSMNGISHMKICVYKEEEQIENGRQ